MDCRDILIANTKTQKRYKISTGAETLGELKAALDANGIDYGGMTFTEGISKTQLIDDASQLPRDIEYKGSTTNNLVFLLTNTQKQIASGAGDIPSRANIFEIIKKEELQDIIAEEFNKPYMQIPSANLWKFVSSYLEEKAAEEKRKEAEAQKEEKEECKGFKGPDPSVFFGASICRYVARLVDSDCLCPVAALDLAETLMGVGEGLARYIKKEYLSEDPADKHIVKDKESNGKIDEVLDKMSR